MPRPGPRPYDCIRRAWHSDTHQPMRGLLIQEIFRSSYFFSLYHFVYICVCMCPFSVFYAHLFICCRIVCEIHSQSTKKNTEWQEKLPVVVLRAEEIMYSKANSEVFLSLYNIQFLSLAFSIVEVSCCEIDRIFTCNYLLHLIMHIGSYVTVLDLLLMSPTQLSLDYLIYFFRLSIWT